MSGLARSPIAVLVVAGFVLLALTEQFSVLPAAVVACVSARWILRPPV